MISICAMSALLFAQAPSAEYSVQWGEKIVLPDGVALNATVYRPLGMDKTPVIFTLTPYMADSYHVRAHYFAQHGYAFALVDTRGRGNSSGTFDPLRQELKDAANVASYFAKANYGTGEVTMWGGSYAGNNQWAAAAKQPAGLFTIVPVASPYPSVDFPTNRGVNYPYVMQWLTLTSGALAQNNLFGENQYWSSKNWITYSGARPFAELDQVLGNPSPIFQEWLKHEPSDSYWNSYAPAPQEIASISIPILSITGQYDGDQPGALAFYRQHMRSATAAAKARHYLLIGPWDHPGTRTPAPEVAGLKFGDASLVDMNALHLAWYEHTRGKGALPEILKDQVSYYMAGSGAENWRYAPTLEQVSGTPSVRYFSSPDNNPNRLFQSGELASTHRAQPYDSYIYDPLVTRRGEHELAAPSETALISESDAFQTAGDALIYHSEPFTEDLEIAGFFKARLFLQTDVPDTDVVVSVYAIGADGGSIYLSGQLQRARYRQGAKGLLKPSEINEFRFEDFSFVARRLSKGSRLRVMIGAADSLQLQRNFNSGKNVNLETIKDARVATVRLMLGKNQPSSIEIPIAAKSSK